MEFRINGEDPGRSFLPAPGRITKWNLPSGPGVRVDAGFKSGDTIGGNFDSLLAKLIVTGATRKEAIERARRALAEFEVDGLATQSLSIALFCRIRPLLKNFRFTQAISKMSLRMRYLLLHLALSPLLPESLRSI